MSNEEMFVLEQFRKGFDCSQVVLMAFADELGYDEEELARMSSAFGGGMFHGDTCGAVTGALMALGMRFGHDSFGQNDRKQKIQEKVAEFEKAFLEEKGSLFCRDLIGFDVAKGEFQEAVESGVVMDRCPGNVLMAIAEVQRLFEED
ncbi:MAG: C-GCAxxG-C-C family protein [Lachnospiraceae bacterium]|nr:C-GCAxxG-C-C family protein [Lachnospiraceae bacterium]